MDDSLEPEGKRDCQVFFFLLKLVRLNSSALRVCWLPPKRDNYRFPIKSII